MLFRSGAILEYLQETQKTALAHIVKLTAYSTSEFMVLDRVTRRNLELIHTLAGTKGGSLLSVLDDTVTSMGEGN